MYWYENGNKKEVGQYFIDLDTGRVILNYPPVLYSIDKESGLTMISKAGSNLKDGEWLNYNSEGILIEKKRYSKGKEIK